MRAPRRRDLLSGAGALLATGFAGAETWPTRPIKLIVPFPGGSSPDLVARALAEPLTKALGQVLIVDNRPGAGGNIGTGVAAKSAPDGYTFLLTIQGPLVTAPLLNKRLPYDPLKDLMPLCLVASSPNMLVVDPRLGAQSLAEFVRVAKAAKGSLNYGSVGNGSAAHLAMESFKSRAGLDLTHVPYAGFPQVVNALLAGQIQAAFVVPGQAMGQVKAGKLNALGLTSLGRVASLPELPTLAEQGFAGFEAISWQALLAPAGTPAAIARRFSEAAQAIIRSEAFRARLLTQYFSAIGGSAEALSLRMREDRQRWAQLIQAAKIQGD